MEGTLSQAKTVNIKLEIELFLLATRDSSILVPINVNAWVTGHWSGSDTQCKGMLLIHYDDDDDDNDDDDDVVAVDDHRDKDDDDDDIDDDDDGNDVDDYHDQNDFPFYYSLNKLFYVHRVNSTFTTRISVMINIRVKFIGKSVINKCFVA